MQKFWVHIARFCPLFFLACLSLAFTVTPGQAEQVQLAWDAPVQSDGRPFPTLAGYKLYSGSRSGQYQTPVSVGTATTYPVTNLSPGQTYYFAVTAHTTSGGESPFSNEISVAIPDTPLAGVLIPQQQLRVVSVDSQDLVGGNYAAVNALDGRSTTMWHTEWKLRAPKHPHTLVLDLGGLYQVDGLKYLPRQDGLSNGTIAAYEFSVSPDGLTWGSPAVAGTLAANITEKTVRFPAKLGRFVRLVALSEINGLPYTSAAEMNIFGVALAALDTDQDGISNAQEVLLGTNPLLADTDGDGLSDGMEVATTRTNPLRVDTDGDGLTDGAEVTTHRTNPLLADTDGDGRSDGDEIRDGSNPLVINTIPDTPLAGVLIPQQQLRVVSVDSQDLVGGNYAAVNALDGRSTTMWHTEWKLRAPKHPHTLVLDLGGLYQVDGLKYLPRQDGLTNGTIAAYEFSVSPDGLTWGSPAVAGTLAANITEKTVRFPAKLGRFVRLVALSEINGQPYTSAAEMNIFGVALAALIPQQQLRVVSVDSQDLVGGNYAAVNALDGRSTTMWHTEWKLRAPKHPHTLVLDLGGLYQVDGLKYLPRQDGLTNGTIAAYEFSVSPDGLTWGSPAVAGTLAANITEKTVRFPAKLGRFVRLVALSEINGQPYTSAAEINIFGVALAALRNAQGVLLDTNSLRADTDGNSLTDGAEITTHRTNPLLADTDGDGRSSGDEIRGGSNPSVMNTTASQHTRWEVALTSTHTYTNPFADVTVSVEYRKAGAPPIQGYAFWDGGSTFKLRQAFPTPGTWHYKTTATNSTDSGLHNREGIVDVLPYTGTNPLYRHGFLQVSANQRFLEHADGTPFLWLGDTLWGATVWLTEAGFKSAVADRRAKHFTVLQSNIAHKAEVDTHGDTPWVGDRWNVRFMQKLDRMFDDANDQGMYLFVNGLADLLQDRGITQYERLVEMIAIRYSAHFVSFASSMDDPYDVLHERINAAIQRVAPYHLTTQHPGAGPKGQSNVQTTEQYYDTSLVDYVMHQTGVEGNLEAACRNAIEWSQHLYRHAPPKPVINGQTWYEGLRGSTAEIATQLGYLSLLSGNAGYTYSTSLWNARDADIPAWKAFRGATYMQYLYEFFMNLDGGRPLQPRHGLIKNQLTRYQDRMALGVSADGMTYAAFLPQGGTITVDLAALAGSVGVTWYDPFTGQYRDVGITPGGAVRSFASPFGTRQSALVLMVQ